MEGLDKRTTHSQRTCLQTCARKHLIAYVLKIRPATDARALRFGAALHDGVHRFSMGQPDWMGLAIAGMDGRARWRDMPEEALVAYRYDREAVAALLEGYAQRWAAEAAREEIVASEINFEIPIVNPETGRPTPNYTAAGQVDRIVRTGDRLIVRELKSTSWDISDPAADYWMRVRMDSQVSGYYLGAQTMGYDVAGVEYDVIRKPGLRPGSVPLIDEDGVKIVRDQSGQRVRTKDGKKWRETSDREAGYQLQTRPEWPEEFGARLRAWIKEHPDETYQRREYGRDNEALRSAQQEIWDITHHLHYCRTTSRWPRNTSACIGLGKCPYFDFCCNNQIPGEYGVLPQGFILLDDPHVELINSEEAA